MASVLILGGTSERCGLAFSLVERLIDGKHASHIRLADKHLLIPASGLYLTHVSTHHKAILAQASKDGILECMQVNLTAEAGRTKAFTPPSPETPYDYVFDFTGADFDHKADALLLIERVAKLAMQLGQSALIANVKAYVKCDFSELCTKKDTAAEEKDESLPWNSLSVWNYEACRALASVDGLNLVIGRPAIIYGPHLLNSFAGRLLIAEIYKFRKERMENLWSPDTWLNTIHVRDLMAALLRLAEWMSTTGIKKALQIAGTNLPPCRPISKNVHWISSTDSSAYNQQEIEGLCARTAIVSAPIFNIVDDSQTTAGQVAATIGSAVGCSVGFSNTLVNAFAKLNMSAVTAEANEDFSDYWTEMLAKSSPPITQPVLEPIVTKESLSNHGVHLSGRKLQETLKWRAEIKFDVNSVTKVLESLRSETGMWPNATK